MLNYVNESPRLMCTAERRKELEELGVKTTGFYSDMENILVSKGFGLPTEHDGKFGFIHNGYTRICLQYADALADELILLKKLGEI